MRSVILISALTLLCGYGDARGFIHANRVWQGGGFVWMEGLKSIIGFQFGVVMYWLALRQLAAYGSLPPETQTLFWFGATIVAVAVLSGQLFRWHISDQLVAALVLAGIGWLLYRTAA